MIQNGMPEGMDGDEQGRWLYDQFEEMRRLRVNIDWLRDQFRYWSYCTSKGMLETCPEKVEELADFLISLKIAPYYIRNRCLETVRTTRPEPSISENNSPAFGSRKD